MAQKISLLTSLKTIDKLHAACEADLKNVRISADDLKRLLIDHSVMYKALRESSLIKVESNGQ